MNDNSLYQLGGIASILVGVSYVVIGVSTAFILPPVAGVPDVQSPFIYWEEGKLLILVCSLLAHRNNVWPRGLAYLGILSAFTFPIP